MVKYSKQGNDYLWNLIGSVCYSLSSFYYLMLVTRICGVIDGGVFALAYATAQLLLTLGRYGMRTYQATDTKGIYSFREYGITRVITCGAMVLLALPYCVGMGYSTDKLLVFVWVAAMKMVDAAEDVFHGQLQRNEHVALMGQMLAARNLFSCVIFGIIIVLSKNLIFCCCLTAISSLAFCLFINLLAVRRTCPSEKRQSGKNVGQLFRICFPIFISTFLSLYLYNIPKYAIDFFLTEDFQTYYSILFMPSFVITLFSEIITKPVLTAISISWEENLQTFNRLFRRIFLLIAGASVCVVLGGHFIGRWLLELIYGVDLSQFKLHFIILLLGGGLSAAVYISYNILISIRFQRCIIVVYLAVAAVATPATYLLVEHFGMFGAAWAYFLTCLVLEAAFGFILNVQIQKKTRSLSQSA